MIFMDVNDQLAELAKLVDDRLTLLDEWITDLEVKKLEAKNDADALKEEARAILDGAGTMLADAENRNKFIDAIKAIRKLDAEIANSRRARVYIADELKEIQKIAADAGSINKRFLDLFVEMPDSEEALMVGQSACTESRRVEYRAGSLRNLVVDYPGEDNSMGCYNGKVQTYEERREAHIATQIFNCAAELRDKA